MAVPGIITQEGVSKSIDLANQEGFQIIPYKFAVTEQVGLLDSSRDITTLFPTWFEGNISASVKIDGNTVQFNCNIPALTSNEPRFTKEVYIIAEDGQGQDFLLGIAQPTTELVYDPEGELRLRLQFTIDNIDVANLYLFQYTQATEISDHNDDSNAHPIIQEAIKKAGIYPQIAERKFNGQSFDQFPDLAPAVSNLNAVYFDTINNRYAPAILEQTTAQEQPVGVFVSSKEVVVFSGIVDFEHTLNPYTDLYLSNTIAGEYTVTPSPVKVGHTLPDNKLFVSIEFIEDDEQIDPDGNRILTIVPPNIRQLTLEDTNGIRWDIQIDDDGILTSVPNSIREPDPLFRIQKPDLSSAQLKIKTDGTIFVQSPPDSSSLIVDNFYYLESDDGTAWKFTVDNANFLIMKSFQNRFVIQSENNNHFAVKQTSTSHALTYKQVYDVDSLPTTPPLIADLLPTCFYDNGTDVRPIFYDGQDWRYFSDNSIV